MRKKMGTFNRYYSELELKWDRIFARLDEIIRMIENRHKRAKFLLQKGFTLIELLVVVAILGILSTMAMASFNSAQMKARDAQRRSDLSQIRSALELAKSDTLDGTYPNPSSDPAVSSFSTPPLTSTLKNFLETKGYMKVVPNDPKGGTWVYYYNPGAGTTDYTLYSLVACLENTNDPKKDTPDTYTSCTVANGKSGASVTFTAP